MFFFAFLVLISVPQVFAAVSQVHLSWQNDTASTMTIMWSTGTVQSPPTVQYGLTNAYGSTATGVSTDHTGALHTVELTGLSPDTLYHYRVSDDAGAWIQDYTFRTAPAPGSTSADGILFTVVGDKGASSNAVTVNSRLAEQGADLHLIVGDLAYTSSDTTYHTWFDQQAVYASSSPLMPAWGNHDKGEPPFSFAQAHFSVPQNAVATEEYYSYDVGNIHFLAIDSNLAVSNGSAQRTFIQNDLSAASTNPDITWVVVYFHHNMYSGGSSHPDDTTKRGQLQPLFDQYGVDLVLQGHNHNYARTKPVAYNEVIKDNQNIDGPENYDFSGSDHGQVWMVTGGGGQSRHTCSSTPASWVIRCDAVDSFAVVTVDGSVLTLKAYYSNGTLLDDGFTITKSQTITFTPLADATVHQAFPDTNYGNATTLELDLDDLGGQKEAYLKFNVTGSGGVISRAELRITTSSASSSDSDSTGLPYTVNDTSWLEGGITWNTRPVRSITPVPGNVATSISLNQTKVFTVTSAVTGNGVYSFALATNSTNGVDYNSKEAGLLRPELVVTWGSIVNQDTTPPNAWITNPSNGTTVSNTISVTADASDDVGIAGVQFKLDGVNIGAEDTTAPYSVSWDTASSANGLHTLTAVARDAAGNSATSSAVTVNVSNSGPSCVSPPSGIVSWWRAENDALDSASTNNGILVNGVTYVPGKVGTAFNFDGYDDYVNVGNAANLNIPGDYTIEAWVSPATDSSLFGSGWHYISQKGYRNEHGFYSTGGPRFKPQNTAGTSFEVNAGITMLANQWHHIAAVRSGSFVGYYVNGVLKKSRTDFTGDINTGTDVQTIGGRASAGRSWNGAIDEFTIYNRALTASEIQAIYNAGSAGKCAQ